MRFLVKISYLCRRNGIKRKLRISKKGNEMGNKDNIPQFVNSDSFMADKNYVKWLSDLKKRFHIAQLKAAVKVEP